MTKKAPHKETNVAKKPLQGKKGAEKAFKLRKKTSPYGEKRSKITTTWRKG